jgi:hypothetical protein
MLPNDRWPIYFPGKEESPVQFWAVALSEMNAIGYPYFVFLVQLQVQLRLYSSTGRAKVPPQGTPITT